MEIQSINITINERHVQLERQSGHNLAVLLVDHQGYSVNVADQEDAYLAANHILVMALGKRRGSFKHYMTDNGPIALANATNSEINDLARLMQQMAGV